MRYLTAASIIFLLTSIAFNASAETTPQLEQIERQIEQIEQVNDQILESFQQEADKINSELKEGEYEVDAFELWILSKNTKGL